MGNPAASSRREPREAEQGRFAPRDATSVRDRSAGRDFVTARSSFVPSYLTLWRTSLAALRERVERGLDELRLCRMCPRDCDVNRLEDKISVCKTGRYARVSSFFAHHGEEDCLRGRGGSGTIFFAFCNLRCVFCQNFDISWEGDGAREVGPKELARMMIHLQEQGCHNINFVTPEHVVPQILEALPHAIEMGLRLPLVYNTGGYDSAKSLELLEGVVDIYMPDFKMWDTAAAKRLLLAEDYPEVARHALKEMHRQVGPLVFDEDGLALRGVLVRHLVMPGMLEDSRRIFEWIARELSPDTYANVMRQYHPAGRVTRVRGKYADIDWLPAPAEYAEAVRAAQEAGLRRLDVRHPTAGV